MAKQRHYVIHNGEEIRLKRYGGATLDLSKRGIKDLNEVEGLDSLS